MGIYQNLTKELSAHPGTTLVAVSKTKPVSEIEKLYDLGQRDFGENRVQELQEKQIALPSDIKWHLIGSLQKNKVKYIAPYVYLIHSCDNLELARQIHKEALKNKRTIPVLLQIRIAEEDSKQGYEFETLWSQLEKGELQSLSGLEIIGVMGMATFTDDKQQIRSEFAQLKSCFDQIKQTFFVSDLAFKEISMGMSGDYQLALEEGATMVRIGSLLFGSR